MEGFAAPEGSDTAAPAVKSGARALAEEHSLARVALCGRRCKAQTGPPRTGVKLGVKNLVIM